MFWTPSAATHSPKSAPSVAVLVILVLVSACSTHASVAVRVTPSASPSPGTGCDFIMAKGRPAQVHVPRGKPLPAPLVINLHRAAATGELQERVSRIEPLADAQGFLVAYPNAIGGVWNSGGGAFGATEDDVTYLRTLILKLEARGCADPKRVYITGFSNGGGMANRMACDAADLVAAVAPVSGAYIQSDKCNPSRPVPILSFHGTADLVVPIAGASQNGYVYPAVQAWAAAWAVRDGCTAGPGSEILGPTVIPTPRASPYPQAQVLRWTHCKPNTEVTLYEINGDGHTWPGDPGHDGSGRGEVNIDATPLIVSFFLAHSLG